MKDATVARDAAYKAIDDRLIARASGGLVESIYPSVDEELGRLREVAKQADQLVTDTALQPASSETYRNRLLNAFSPFDLQKARNALDGIFG